MNYLKNTNLNILTYDYVKKIKLTEVKRKNFKLMRLTSIHLNIKLWLKKKKTVTKLKIY